MIGLYLLLGAVLGASLSWYARGKRVDALLLAASKRAEETLRSRAFADGYSTGVVVERRTGELYRRTREELPAEMFDADRMRAIDGSDWKDEEAA